MIKPQMNTDKDPKDCEWDDVSRSRQNSYPVFICVDLC